jgi:hypothetical protein
MEANTVLETLAHVLNAAWGGTSSQARRSDSSQVAHHDDRLEGAQHLQIIEASLGYWKKTTLSVYSH